MTTPVDLTNLREITEGDAEMERELFQEFINSCDGYIAVLGTLQEDSKHEAWRTTTHAMKGLALNLGAGHLSELCKQAQENNHAPQVDKMAMLDAIKTEYTAVKIFLNSAIVT